MSQENSHIDHQRISYKLPAIGIAAVVILVLGLIFMQRPEYTYKISDEEMLQELLERYDIVRPEKFMEIYYNHDSLYRFIDLRSAQEYLQGHIPGAIHIPIHKLLDKENKEIFNQDKYINVLYYNDHCGACGPWMLLKQIGYKNNKILQGGYWYVKNNIIDNYSPMSGAYQAEKPRYDFAKIVSETSGASVAAGSSTENNIKPVATKKKENKSEEGGC